jgi:hypothetical protein
MFLSFLFFSLPPPLFFLICGQYSYMLLFYSPDVTETHNVQLVKVYSVVNTTGYSFIASRYSVDDKLHVSALWWPSSGFMFQQLGRSEISEPKEM